MSIPEIPDTKEELWGNLKFGESMNAIPTFTSSTQEIFKLMGASSFNRTTDLQKKVVTLEQMIENKSDPVWDNIGMILRGVMATALLAGAILGCMYGVVPVAIGAAVAYAVLNMWNMYKATGNMDAGLALVSLISGPVPTIIEGIHQFLKQDPKLVFATEKKDLQKQLTQLGKDFENESAKFARKMEEQISLLSKALPTETTQKGIEEYRFALRELEECRKYYAQFKEG